MCNISSFDCQKKQDNAASVFVVGNLIRRSSVIVGDPVVSTMSPTEENRVGPAKKRKGAVISESKQDDANIVDGDDCINAGNIIAADAADAKNEPKFDWNRKRNADNETNTTAVPGCMFGHLMGILKTYNLGKKNGTKDVVLYEHMKFVYWAAVEALKEKGPEEMAKQGLVKIMNRIEVYVDKCYTVDAITGVQTELPTAFFQKVCNDLDGSMGYTGETFATCVKDLVKGGFMRYTKECTDAGETIQMKHYELKNVSLLLINGSRGNQFPHVDGKPGAYQVCKFLR